MKHQIRQVVAGRPQAPDGVIEEEAERSDRPEEGAAARRSEAERPTQDDAPYAIDARVTYTSTQ
jgi:hypothetical protein